MNYCRLVYSELVTLVSRFLLFTLLPSYALSTADESDITSIISIQKMLLKQVARL